MSRIIEIRPYRNGWQCFEGPAVEPFWVGNVAKEQVLGYGKERAKFGRCEIRVLDGAGAITETFEFTKAEY